MIDFLNPHIFGYSFASSDFSRFIIYTHYLGLIIVTEYIKPNYYAIHSFGGGFLKQRDIRTYIKSELKEKIIDIIKERPNVDQILDSGLRDKIVKRYYNEKRIR